MFTEFVGITQEVANLIETHRVNPNETKCDILLRIIPPILHQPKNSGDQILDLGQGAQLKVGEKIVIATTSYVLEEAEEMIITAVNN